MPTPFSRLFGLVICAWIAAGAATDACAEALRRGLGPEPDSLHIHQAQGLAAVNLLRDMREGLVTFDAKGELAPGAADSWEVLDQGRRYRFHLRGDARWSNGDSLTAQDFVRAWRRAFTPATTAVTASLLKDVRNASGVLAGSLEPTALGIRALGQDVVEVELEGRAPWILEILAHPVSYPLHEDSPGDALRSPVNGPFAIGNWVPRASIQLQRNPYFHAATDVRLQSVEYFPIEDASSELSRYRAGELDITETIPAGRFAWLQENLPADLRVHPYLGSFWLGLNLRHAPLGVSADLRRALSLAINRDILVNTVLGAGELPAWSVVPPGISGYNPSLMPMAAASQAEREEEARRIFRQAGFGRHDELLLELRYNTSNVHRRVAVAVAAMWKQVLGVNTQLVNEEWKVFVNNRKMGVVTEVFRGGWIADYADPASFLDLFVSDGALNHTFYHNEDYDRLMNAARRASGNNRMDILAQAETELMQDMPVIPLYYYVSRHLVRPEVTGFLDNVRDVHLSRYLGRERETP
jgi:oligopeptide transport system substrate-binding protein